MKPTTAHKKKPLRKRPLRRTVLALAVALPLLATVLASSSFSTQASGALRAKARTYHVSPSGDDKNPGTAARPWKTLARVSRGSYRAGDRILLEGGERFVGAIAFTPKNAHGTGASPVTVGSYGKGRATIAGSLLAQNVAGIRVTRLRFKGANPSNGGSGIAFLSSTAKPLTGVGISDVEVSGYTNPIFLFTLKPPAQYRGVRIERASVHDNAQGPVLFGHVAHPSTLNNNRFGFDNVVVRRVHSFRNTGAGLKNGHGGGLVIINADDVLVERNLIHDNGGDNPELSPNGPSGITIYDARNLVIQHNEVYHQRFDVKNQTDNDGMDVWARNALIQYNYVHDNEGWGFVLGSSDPKLTGPGASWESRDITLRYNVAVNNGRRLRKSEATIKYLLATVFMFGQVERYEVYNNTFVRSGFRGAGTHPDVVQGMIYLVDVPGAAGPWSHVHFRNNLFVTQGNVTPVEIPRPWVGKDLRFEGNAYVALDGKSRIKWGDRSYDVAAWRAGTGQEMIGGRPVGAVVGGNAFCAAGKGAPLRAYRLRPGSPLIDTALDLRATAGLKVGRRDFFGNRIPAGKGFDVGAHEPRPGKGCGAR